MRGTKEAHPFVLRAESTRLSRDAIEALTGEIPRDVGQVDGLLEECIDGYFARAFTTAALAALHAGVAVDARHLVEGARLLPDPGFIAKLSRYMAGDVVGGLVGSVADGRLSWQREVVALFLAAHWSRERGSDRHRKEIARRTRMLARAARGLELEAFLAATASLLGDDELSGLIARLPAGTLLPAAGRWTQPFLELARAPILDGLSDDDDAAPSSTRRRAVPRVGRNEPCPCGSGKKYKRCCAMRDEERLRDSSDIAGVTRAELRLHLEDHLTLERVRSLKAHELARLDPKRIDLQLHGIVLNRLIAFEEWGALRDFFEAAGVGGFEDHVWDAASAALRAGKPDTARSLVKMAPLPTEECVGFSERMLSAGIEHSPALDILEAEARRSIDGSAVDLACDLLCGPWAGLGILVARGVAPLAQPWDRDTLLEEIGLARDRLDLPALDPTEGMEDIWGWSQESELYVDAPLVSERAHAAEAAPPRDEGIERMLADKEAALARLRQELSELHRKLDERPEKVSESQGGALAPVEAPLAEDPRVARLKERVSTLRNELSQRHAERNQLRRQLERTRKHVDALEAERANAERPPAEDDVSDYDSEAEPDDANVALSFRIPVFSRRFRSSSEALSDPIRRRAVILTSRIAAGDENAFRGTRRLRRDRDLYRQRVGREHRLIFRMHAQELEAVDLVPRKDLERTIRELSRG